MGRFRRTAPALLLCVCAAGCSGQGSGTSAPPSGPAVVADAAPGWSMTLGGLEYPNRPAAGKLHGRYFVPEQAKWEAGTISFRSGKEFFPDQEIKVVLFRDDAFLAQGAKLELQPDTATKELKPQMQLSWKVANSPLPETEMIMDRYALKLELGKPTGSKVPGKIYLSLPDEAHSFLAGTFTLDVPTLTGQKVHGRITRKVTGKGELSVGYTGATPRGDSKSGFAGFTLGGEQEGSANVSSSNTYLAIDDKGNLTYRHDGVLPGTYLFYVTWNKHYYDGKWIEIRDQKETALDLVIDPERVGSLEVKLPPGGMARKVQLLPLDASGKLPLAKPTPQMLAFDLAAFVEKLVQEAKPGQDKVEFKELAAGNYRVLSDKASVDATVQPGKTAAAELPAKP